MKSISYNVAVNDSVKNPYTTETPKYKKEESNSKDLTYYKVWVYLDGPDLAFIKRVKYTLHHTFRNRERIVERSPSNPKCALAIWTWGVFTIKAEIEDIGGRVFEVEHYLTYGEEIAKDKSLNWEVSGAAV